MEGDVEFNDDEDDISSMGVITRRLNLTTNATGNFQSSLSLTQSQLSHKEDKSCKLYGIEANKLFLKCFQYILKRQCQWLIEEKKFPTVFEDIVKIIWMSYLKVLSQHDQLVQEDTSDDDVSMHKRDKNRLGISMVSSISILYMAGVHLGLPVYTSDYIEWICSMKLLYFKANLQLPTVWRKQLPNHYLQILEGGKPPSNAQFFHKIAYTCSKIHFTSTFNTRVLRDTLIFKLIISTRLLPDLYYYTKKLIRMVDENGNFKLVEHEKKHFRKLYIYPELRTVAYFILAVKWSVFVEDDHTLEFIRNWLNLKSSGQDDDFNEEKVVKVSYKKQQADVLDWTKQETSMYLDWMEKFFLPGTRNDDIDNEKLGIDQKIALRKLYNIFPKETEASKEPEQQKALTFIEDLQEKYLRLTEVRVQEEHTSETDILLMSRLESKLIKELARDFAVSREQLEYCVKTIEKLCIRQLKKDANV